MHRPIIPPSLNRGDTIGIFAPAGYPEDIDGYHQGIEILKDYGFQVREPERFWPGQDYLADTDYNRGEEFNRLWQDPEIKALLALRGGYGCLRILDKINLRAVEQNSKLLIGFSDVSVLHNYLNEKTGLVTLHGPVLMTLSNLDKPSRNRFFYSLLGKWNKTIDCPDLEILRGGDNVQGILTGGNLSSIATMIGTEYMPDWQGKIVVLEDIQEPVYRLDRLFTQLTLAGMFDGVHGLILGDFSTSYNQDRLEKIKDIEKVWSRVLELTDSLNIPIWGGFHSGHTPSNMTLPVGAIAVMNSRKGVLEFIA